MFDLVIKMLVLKTRRCSSFGKLGFLFFPNNFNFFLPDTKMKAIMPYVTWRVVGRSSRKKKQRGK